MRGLRPRSAAPPWEGTHSPPSLLCSIGYHHASGDPPACSARLLPRSPVAVGLDHLVGELFGVPEVAAVWRAVKASRSEKLVPMAIWNSFVASSRCMAPVTISTVGKEVTGVGGAGDPRAGDEKVEQSRLGRRAGIGGDLGRGDSPRPLPGRGSRLASQGRGPRLGSGWRRRRWGPSGVALTADEHPSDCQSVGRDPGAHRYYGISSLRD